MDAPFDEEWKQKPDDESISKFDLNEWHSIRIVHFINPHCFYFKLADLPGHIEKKIDQILAESIDSQPGDCRLGYEPTENEMVAAFIPTYGRWVRAQIDTIICVKESKEYVVWCLDYG